MGIEVRITALKMRLLRDARAGSRLSRADHCSLNSKIIMDMTTEGRNANEIAAALNMQRKSVIRTARRHGIDIIK